MGWGLRLRFNLLFGALGACGEEVVIPGIAACGVRLETELVTVSVSTHQAPAVETVPFGV
jgi:hypothetical protein